MSKMILEVPEAMEEALKATSRTWWIRKDLALSVGADTTTGRTNVSTSVNIVGCKVIIAPRTARTRIGKGTDLKKEEVNDPKAGIAMLGDNLHLGY